MPIIMVATRADKPEVKIEFVVSRKLILGNSMYCDVILEDRSIANMQCEIMPVKTGHVVARNLDLKKEVHLNHLRLKRSALKASDILKIGIFELKMDVSQLTEEEAAIVSSEYEEFV